MLWGKGGKGIWSVSGGGDCKLKEEGQKEPHWKVTCKHRPKGGIMRMSGGRHARQREQHVAKSLRWMACREITV